MNYKTILKNINDFKFKKVKLKDPLRKEIEYGEGWKKYIKAILEISKEKNNYQFTPNELALFLKLTTHGVNKYIKKLIKLGFLKLIKESEKIRVGKLIKGADPRIYALTDLRLKKAKFL